LTIVKTTENRKRSSCWKKTELYAGRRKDKFEKSVGGRGGGGGGGGGNGWVVGGGVGGGVSFDTKLEKRPGRSREHSTSKWTQSTCSVVAWGGCGTRWVRQEGEIDGRKKNATG